MTLPNPKELKKLADTCRKAGIKHFRCEGFEFTLTEDVPVSEYKRRKQAKEPKEHHNQGDIETDGLSQEDLLFWSSGGEETPEEKTLTQ